MWDINEHSTLFPKVKKVMCVKYLAALGATEGEREGGDITESIREISP
jgi:hypothetical protein